MKIILWFRQILNLIFNFICGFLQVEAISAPESSFQGKKPQDHRVLCNVVNLYRDLMRALDSSALTEWLPLLIPVLLKRSASFPLVSAFYKLLAATLSVADSTNYFQVICIEILFNLFLLKKVCFYRVEQAATIFDIFLMS